MPVVPFERSIPGTCDFTSLEKIVKCLNFYRIAHTTEIEGDTGQWQECFITQLGNSIAIYLSRGDLHKRLCPAIEYHLALTSALSLLQHQRISCFENSNIEQQLIWQKQAMSHSPRR